MKRVLLLLLSLLAGTCYGLEQLPQDASVIFLEKTRDNRGDYLFLLGYRQPGEPEGVWHQQNLHFKSEVDGLPGNFVYAFREWHPSLIVGKKNENHLHPGEMELDIRYKTSGKTVTLPLGVPVPVSHFEIEPPPDPSKLPVTTRGILLYDGKSNKTNRGDSD